MKKTLLHFITGCVTRHEARRFWRALGDSEQEAKEFIQKIQKSYEPGSHLGGFFKHLTKKLFGLEKSPFDLSPEELARLTKVIDNRIDEIQIRLKLVKELFDTQPDPQEVAYKVSDFYVHHKQNFVSAKDIDYDSEENILSIKTEKRLLERLLRKLGVKEEYIKKLIDGKEIPGLKSGNAKKYEIPFRDITDAQKEYGTADLKTFEKVVNNVLKNSSASVSLRDESTPKDATLVFTGELQVLEDLLYRMFREQNKTGEGKKHSFFPVYFENQVRIDKLIERLKAGAE